MTVLCTFAEGPRRPSGRRPLGALLCWAGVRCALKMANPECALWPRRSLGAPPPGCSLEGAFWVRLVLRAWVLTCDLSLAENRNPAPLATAALGDCGVGRENQRLCRLRP